MNVDPKMLLSHTNICYVSSFEASDLCSFSIREGTNRIFLKYLDEYFDVQRVDEIT